MRLTRRRTTIQALTLIWTLSLLVIAPASADSLPEWVSRPPPDTADAWYGVGEGEDLESAKAQALADLAGRLATKVLSDVKIDQYSEQWEDGSRFNESISSMVSTQVENTKLSHYQLRESQSSGGKTYALVETGDRELFPELHIPRSTIRSWIHGGAPDVISCDLAAYDHAELAAEIENLRRRTALLGTVVGLLIAIIRVSKVQLDYERLPEGDAKRILLRAIERARKVLPQTGQLCPI